jgi:hypothetical protein
MGHLRIFVCAAMLVLACAKRSGDGAWPPRSGAIEVSKGKAAGVLRFADGRVVATSYEDNAGGADLKAVVMEIQKLDAIKVTTHDPESDGYIGITARPGEARYMQAVYVTLSDRGFGAKLVIP